jgi:hypothetical protein
MGRLGWILALAGGGVAITAAVLWAKDSTASSSGGSGGQPSPATPPAPTGPGSTYNSSGATTALLQPTGATLTVPVGTSVMAQNSAAGPWASPGTITSNAAVLAPSNPSTTNGYVAMQAGTATISGSYLASSGASIPVSILVTVQ